MATVKKGSGTTTRRRATTKKAAAVQQSNGDHARNEPAAVEPTSEAIRARAYELFLARGASHGNDLADWFAAEQELRAARAT
jgi:hypothetical protein